MKKFNFFCSILVVLTMTISIIGIAQNITLRTTGVYTFYFNDTYVVSRTCTEYTNSGMADEIAGFFNSWNPKEFQLYEDTGYDIEGIFDDKDSYNMLIIKRALDISLLLCVVSVIVTFAIYRYFLQNNFKLALRNGFKASMVLTTLALIGELLLLNTGKGMSIIMDTLGLKVLEEDSNLLTLLGGDFIGLADNFLFGFTVVIMIGVGYVVHVLTRPPKIFF